MLFKKFHQTKYRIWRWCWRKAKKEASKTAFSSFKIAILSTYQSVKVKKIYPIWLNFFFGSPRMKEISTLFRLYIYLFAYLPEYFPVVFTFIIVFLYRYPTPFSPPFFNRLHSTLTIIVWLTYLYCRSLSSCTWLGCPVTWPDTLYDFIEIGHLVHLDIRIRI